MSLKVDVVQVAMELVGKETADAYQVPAAVLIWT